MTWKQSWQDNYLSSGLWTNERVQKGRYDLYWNSLCDDSRHAGGRSSFHLPEMSAVGSLYCRHWSIPGDGEDDSPFNPQIEKWKYKTPHILHVNKRSSFWKHEMMLVLQIQCNSGFSIYMIYIYVQLSPCFYLLKKEFEAFLQSWLISLPLVHHLSSNTSQLSIYAGIPKYPGNIRELVWGELPINIFIIITYL